MAVAVRSSTNQPTYASRSNTSFTKPTGTASGDRVGILMFAANAGASAPSITAPSGFSAAAGNPMASYNDGSPFTGALYLFWRDCDGSEGSSFATTHSAASTVGVCFAMTGCDPAIAPRVSTPANHNGSNGLTATAGSVTATSSSALSAVAVFAWDSATGAVPPSGYTSLFQPNNQMFVSTKVLSAAGATGSQATSVPNNLDNTGAWGAVQVVFEALASGALAATEGTDTASMAGSVSAAGTTAALAATEAADTASATGTVTVSGALAASEPSDTASLAGTVLVSGTLAATEAADTAAMAGQAVSGPTASLAATEAADTASFAASIISSGTLIVSETADVAAFSFSVPTSALLAASEAADFATFFASLPVSWVPQGPIAAAWAASTAEPETWTPQAPIPWPGA